MDKKIWIYLGVIFGVLVLAIVLINQVSDRKPSGQPQTYEEGASETSEDQKKKAQEEETEEIELEVGEYEYSPSQITVSKGREVTVVLKNKGTIQHNFVIDELNLFTKTVLPGREDSITFVADEEGSYTFYCSIGSHRQLGLEGTLIVK